MSKSYLQRRRSDSTRPLRRKEGMRLHHCQTTRPLVVKPIVVGSGGGAQHFMI